MKVQRCIVALLFTAIGLLAAPARAQTQSPTGPPEKLAMPYANQPPAARPYAGYRKPYQEWYVQPDTLDYAGAAGSERDGTAAALKAINIGFLGPLDADNEDSPYGIAMLHGAQLAIDEANASGGYHGKPFALCVHDDLALWGASAMAIVDMRFKDQAWAMLGSVDSASTHIEVRATLKLELPIMDTATNDPTVTQTLVPWLVHNFPDDRQQGYALADYIFLQRHLKRIGILQVNNRYGRTGKEIFFATARRIGHQPVVDVWYGAGTSDFSSQLRTINASGVDGLVVWGNATQAGLILKQMRAMGMQQPVFGSSRIGYPEVIKIAGPAAEGLVLISAINPTRNDLAWLAFRQHFVERFHDEPDAYAAYAYDGAKMLTIAINQAGLNRGRIMDALRGHEMKGYAGVSGNAFFDYTLNNIAPVTFAQVRDGKFVYWPEQRTDWKIKNVANGQ
ncbi:MAG: ABC transporter substrate-binding protein [Acidobacteriota bacterium]|nr:ABC transporter substrate-binding protein [Acidobacteriota bacterium]